MREAALAAAGYLVVFAALAIPLYPELAHGVSTVPNLDDAQLIVWILAWVAHALATDPAHLFDAGINFPAAAQLTGSDHFFASQVLFAPLYGATGNPILAANLTALLTYPLAAIAMQRLLRAVGCSVVVSCVCGLAFALGPRRVPFNLHVLQYPNLFLPLVALALVRLREDPSLGRALRLTLVFALGLLSSFYMAVMLGLTGLVWGACELARRLPRRGRFLVLGSSAAVIAGAILLFATFPYFERAGGVRRKLQTYAPSWSALVAALRGRLPGSFWDPLALAVIPAAAVSLAAWRSPATAVRRIVPPALALAAIALLMMPGFPEPLTRIFGGSPLRFFAYPVRFQVLFGFAAALLLATGLEGLRGWLGERSVSVLAAATALVVLFVQGFDLPRTALHQAPSLAQNALVYDEVGEIVRAEGGGALLELPLQGAMPASSERSAMRTLEPDAMLGSTRHWIPLVNAYTGYHPPHRTLLMETIGGLPASWAVSDLVDLTGMRWMLLRPARDWRGGAPQRNQALAKLARSPWVGQVWRLGEFDLLRLDRAPAHPEWIEALAHGAAAEQTLLGTTIGPLAESDAVGRITAPRAPSSVAAQDDAYATVATIENGGRVTWPAVVAGEKQPVLAYPGSRGASEAHATELVTLVATWRRLDTDSKDAGLEETEVPLRRDVAAGDSIAQPIVLPVPPQAGRYELELHLRQTDGARFDDPRNEPLRQVVDVERGAGGSSEPKQRILTAPEKRAGQAD